MSIATRFAGLPEREIPGWLCAGGLHPDRRNPQIQSGQRLLWRRCAGQSVLAQRRRLGRMGNRRARQHRSISTISLAPPTASPVDDRPSTRLALNWYINRNVRFMFNYLHGDVPSRSARPTSAMPARSSMRLRCERRWRSRRACQSRREQPRLLLSLRKSRTGSCQPQTQPERWAKLGRFMGDFPIVYKQGLVPHIYSTCQIDASATVKSLTVEPRQENGHEGRRIQEVASRSRTRMR